MVAAASKSAVFQKRKGEPTSGGNISRKRSCPNKWTELSMRFAKQFFKYERHSIRNIHAFSPLSMSVLFSLLASGSAGATLDRLLHLLDAETLDDVNSLASELISIISPGDGRANCGWGPTLSFACAAWLEQSLSLKGSFKKCVTASPNRVDFKNEVKAEELAKEVILWGKKATHGCVQQAIPLDAFGGGCTRLVLANAISFKGEWAERFRKSQMIYRDFYLLSGETVEMPFLTSQLDQFVSEFDGFKVLKLAYRHGEEKHRFCMYLFLPDARDGLPGLTDKIMENPGLLESCRPETRVQVGEFMIPYFESTFGMVPSAVLVESGGQVSFSDDDVELTEMVDDCPVRIRLPESCLNQKGTAAAAAATAADVVDLICGKDPVDFVADHPFLFMVRDDVTGVVLFIGRRLH